MYHKNPQPYTKKYKISLTLKLTRCANDRYQIYQLCIPVDMTYTVNVIQPIDLSRENPQTPITISHVDNNIQLHIKIRHTF
jgi:hypothetical protein